MELNQIRVSSGREKEISYRFIARLIGLLLDNVESMPHVLDIFGFLLIFYPPTWKGSWA